MRRAWRWIRDPEHALFLAVTLLHVAPIWWFAMLPSQDGPAHTGIAALVTQLGDPTAHALHATFTRTFELTPYWTGYTILAGLQSVLTPVFAEKVFLTLYTVGLATGLRYFFTGLRADAGLFATCALFLLHGYLFHIGFWNFCIALAVSCWWLGSWLRLAARPTHARTAALAALGVVLYFSHLTVTILTFMAVAILGLGWGLGRLRAREPRAVLDLGLRTVIAVLPAMLLGLHYAAKTGVTTRVPVPLGVLGDRLLEGDCLVSFNNEIVLGPRAVYFLVALLLGSLALKMWRGRWFVWDLVGLVALGWLAVYLLGPDNAGNGGMITVRVSWFVYLGCLAWAAVQEWPRRARRVILGLGLVLVLSFWWQRVRVYARIEPELVELEATGEHLPRGSIFLPLIAFQDGNEGNRPVTGRIRALINVPDRIAAGRQAACLQQFVASTDFSPVHYQPGVDPYQQLTRRPHGIGGDPPNVNLDSYHARTGNQLDALLVWNIPGWLRAQDPLQAVWRTIDREFELAYTSPSGRGQVYLRKRPEAR